MSSYKKSFRDTNIEEIDLLLETEVEESKQKWRDKNTTTEEAIWNYGRYYLAINLRLWLNDEYPDSETFNKSEGNPP